MNLTPTTKAALIEARKKYFESLNREGGYYSPGVLLIGLIVDALCDEKSIFEQCIVNAGDPLHDLAEGYEWHDPENLADKVPADCRLLIKGECKWEGSPYLNRKCAWRTLGGWEWGKNGMGMSFTYITREPLPEYARRKREAVKAQPPAFTPLPELLLTQYQLQEIWEKGAATITDGEFVSLYGQSRIAIMLRQEVVELREQLAQLGQKD